MVYRSSDNSNYTGHYDRSDRFVVADDGFYYRTREGEVRGPFVTQSEANFDLNIFLEVISIEQQLNEDALLKKAWG